ncbi:Uncharacterised protein [Listeria grayi]|uniref:PIN-like domain-containing protein n=1 Tax=Listeria grayi TaxID=1641 RepID=UPI000F6EB047|nr:PIN-like domain-containing protein [Listeria grayi]VEI34264.1 Uncharacterised protein [Listeria grayi]
MKEIFEVFYQDAEIDFNNIKSDELIVFDTNFLLHIFRYSNESRGQIVKAIEKVKDSVLVPYIVGLEYHFNKQNGLREIKKGKTELINGVNGLIEDIETKFIPILDSFSKLIRSKDEKAISEEIKSTFSDDLKKFIQKFQDEVLSKELNLIDNQDKGEILAELLKGKVNNADKREIIKFINEHGKDRYDKQVPPGYLDKKVKEGDIRTFGDFEYDRMYGDLILWKEILLYCEKNKIKKCVLISDDLKEDWLYVSKGERVGPRVELKQELWKNSQTTLSIMDSNAFLQSVFNERTNISKDRIDYKAQGIFKNNIDYSGRLGIKESVILRSRLFQKLFSNSFRRFKIIRNRIKRSYDREGELESINKEIIYSILLNASRDIEQILNGSKDKILIIEGNYSEEEIVEIKEVLFSELNNLEYLISCVEDETMSYLFVNISKIYEHIHDVFTLRG